MTGHIILAGGGHANALALLQLAKHKGRGKITLVSEDSHTPYSGMLPGYIAGQYRREQCFINLQHTAAKCNASFIAGRVRGIKNNSVILQDGRALAFDVLSLNTGAIQPQPTTTPVECSVKPIGKFIEWLDEIESSGNIGDKNEYGGGDKSDDGGGGNTIAIVGGGAGGVEVALALARRWRDKMPGLSYTLVAPQVLPSAPPAARRQVMAALAASGISVAQTRAMGYDESARALRLQNGRALPCRRVVYSTAVQAASWLADTGLARDSNGFLQTNDFLQSPQNARVYISGDAAAHTPALPKSGVMAVRQAKTLAHNLPRAAGWTGGALKRFNKSAAALYIIGDGGAARAIAYRNGVTVSGKWVWRWKHYLDTKFMNKFR